jgi:hypothetical protein
VTPGELSKIKSAVAAVAADLIARENNEDTTAESLAEELAEATVEAMVSSYEDIQARSYNMIILGEFRPAVGEGPAWLAAVGPLSTRAVQRARDVGERFAWDYRNRRGTGRFMLVPLVRDPREAWDATRTKAERKAKKLGITPGVEPSYEPMNFEMDDETLASISATWEIDEGVLARKFGPGCLCGLPDHPRYNGRGDLADMTCPRHPEGKGT